MSKKDNFGGKIFIGIICCIIITILAKSLFEKYMLSSCYRITVAKPIDIKGGYKGGYSLVYKYQLNDDSFEDEDVIDKTEYLRNGKSYYLKNNFFLKVSCDYPSITSLLAGPIVPKSIIDVPKNGWDTIPSDVK